MILILRNKIILLIRDTTIPSSLLQESRTTAISTCSPTAPAAAAVSTGETIAEEVSTTTKQHRLPQKDREGP